MFRVLKLKFILKKFSNVAVLNNNYNTHSESKNPILEHYEIPTLVAAHDGEVNTEYLLAYLELIRDLTHSGGSQMLDETKQRLVKVLKHTIPYGRQFEGLGVINSYELIESNSNLTPKNIKLAHILSWCVAMQGATYILQDDTMDGEETRKHLPCWHTFKNIGLNAISDSWLVQYAIHKTLKTYFVDHPYYNIIRNIFHEINYKTGFGQSIDMACMSNGRPTFKKFTRSRINYLGDFKSAFFSYEFPVKLAMALAGISDSQLHARAKSITSKIGYLFMVHNDVQDTFGLPEVVGKGSTDVRNGKCTWLSVETLERASLSQRKLFEKHYGISCTESEQIIHNLYKDLKLSEVYLETERRIIKQIYKEMDEISHQIPKQVFVNLLTDVTLFREGYCYNH